jgi:hypothetical protein
MGLVGRLFVFGNMGLVGRLFVFGNETDHQHEVTPMSTTKKRVNRGTKATPNVKDDDDEQLPEWQQQDNRRRDRQRTVAHMLAAYWDTFEVREREIPGTRTTWPPDAEQTRDPHEGEWQDVPPETGWLHTEKWIITEFMVRFGRWADPEKQTPDEREIYQLLLDEVYDPDADPGVNRAAFIARMSEQRIGRLTRALQLIIDEVQEERL